MLVEVADSGIVWTEPRDLSLDSLATADGKSPALTVSSNHGRRQEFFFIYDRGVGVNVAMADGNWLYLPLGGLSSDLREILQIGGFSFAKLDDDGVGFDERRRPNWPNIAALAVWILSVGTLLTKAVRSRRRLSVPPPPTMTDPEPASAAAWWIGDGHRRSTDNKLCFPLYSNAEWTPIEQVLDFLREKFQASILSELHGPEDSNIYYVFVRGIRIVLFYDSGWDLAEFYAENQEDEQAAVALADELRTLIGKRPEMGPPGAT